MGVITRKIQLLLVTATKEEWLEAYERLLAWQLIVSKAANWIVTHHYVQENLKEMVYLTEGMKIKLADIRKDENGILTTSRMNTTYKLLSGRLKEEIPMSIIGALNNRIVSTFNKEKNEYHEGKRSLRIYRKDQPIPVVSTAITRIVPVERGEYEFSLFGLVFRTNFGRDASGNRALFDRAASGKSPLHESSLQIRNNKLFLLAVFNWEMAIGRLSPDVRVEARLTMEVPIVAVAGEREISIGSREEYLYRRLAIQDALRRTQAALRFTRGGKGRRKKMRALHRFQELEKQYVQTRLHQYSARLIAFCRREGAGVLVLKTQLEKERVAKDDAFLLRNWGYYRLKEKIAYKAAKYGITVIIE